MHYNKIVGLSGNGARYGKFSVHDKAGNTATLEVYVNIDNTLPVISKCKTAISNGYVYLDTSSTNYQYSDALSGIKSGSAKYSVNKPTTPHYDAWQYGSKQFSWAKKPIDVNHWYVEIDSSPIKPVPVQSFKNTVKVNTHLNIRNKPITGDIIGRLNNGDTVSVIGYEKGWLQIGNNEWVSETYVHSSYGRVNANSLNVRKGNSTAYESIGFVYKNNNVKIVKELGGWYQIITPSGLFGWASSKYIDLI